MAALGQMPTWGDATKEKRIEVLERLGSDPDFYKQMQTDPVGAFASEGISLDPGEVGHGPFRLPTSQYILDNLDEIAGNKREVDAYGHDTWRDGTAND